MTFDVLTDAVRADVQTLTGLYAQVGARALPIFVALPPTLGLAGGFDFGSASSAVDEASDQGLASAPVTLVGDWGLASDPSTSVACRFADDQLDVEEFAQHLFATKTLALRTVRV